MKKGKNKLGEEKWEFFIKVALGIALFAFLIVGTYYLFKKLGVA